MVTMYKNVAYLITNKINGKQYVGITTMGFNRRWNGHCNNTKPYSAISRAIRKYGKDAFDKKILFAAQDINYLLEIEPKIIKAYGTKTPNGYNLTDGGEGTVGKIMTDAERASHLLQMREVGQMPEVRKERSDRAKKANADAKFRNAQATAMKDLMSDPVRKAKWLEKTRASMRTDEMRKIRSENQRRLMEDPVHKAKVAASCKEAFERRRLAKGMASND